MIINDLAEVIYAPARAFKKIVENPKYLGVLIVLLLFMAVMIGYEYAQFGKTYTEQTSPTVDQLPSFLNASLWRGGGDVTFRNNSVDYYNYSVYVAALNALPTESAGYYNLFGNGSLEMNAGATNVSAALGNAFNVNCGSNGFQNLSMAIKLVSPQNVPQSADVKLYSINDTGSYTYDLTSALSSTSAINLWQNLTIPVGTTHGWTASGHPTWGNITSLQVDFIYPFSSNITIRIGALYFGGEYQTPVQNNSLGLLLQFLQVFSLQFIFTWLLLTGLIFLLFKILKATVTWKPVFIAVAMALFVMVIRGVVGLVTAFTLPASYYPYDLSLGVRFDSFGAIYYPVEAVSKLSLSSQAIYNNITAATAGFHYVTEALFVISYVWLGALCTIIVGHLKPEFSMPKRIGIAAVSVIITIFLLLLLVGVV